MIILQSQSDINVAMQAGAAFYWTNLYPEGVEDDHLKGIMKDVLPDAHKRIVCVGGEASIEKMKNVALKPGSLPDNISISYETYRLYGSRERDYEYVVDHKAGSVYLYGISISLIVKCNAS